MIDYSDILKLGCFTKGELIDLCGSVQNADYYIQKFLKKDLLAKVKNGLYCVIDASTGAPTVNHFVIASKINSNGYVSFHTALEYYGWYEQVFNIAYISAAHNFKTISFQNREYQSVYNSYKFGIVNENNVRITDPERTIIDCVNRFSLSGGLEELVAVIQMIGYLDEKRVVEYLTKYNNQFLFAKLGYLFECFNPSIFTNEMFSFLNNHIMKVRMKIDNTSKDCNCYDKRWRLYVPQSLLNRKEIIV